MKDFFQQFKNLSVIFCFVALLISQLHCLASFVTTFDNDVTSYMSVFDTELRNNEIVLDAEARYVFDRDICLSDNLVLSEPARRGDVQVDPSMIEETVVAKWCSIDRISLKESISSTQATKLIMDDNMDGVTELEEANTIQILRELKDSTDANVRNKFNNIWISFFSQSSAAVSVSNSIVNVDTDTVKESKRQFIIREFDSLPFTQIIGFLTEIGAIAHLALLFDNGVIPHTADSLLLILDKLQADNLQYHGIVWAKYLTAPYTAFLNSVNLDQVSRSMIYEKKMEGSYYKLSDVRSEALLKFLREKHDRISFVSVVQTLIQTETLEAILEKFKNKIMIPNGETYYTILNTLHIDNYAAAEILWASNFSHIYAQFYDELYRIDARDHVYDLSRPELVEIAFASKRLEFLKAKLFDVDLAGFIHYLASREIFDLIVQRLFRDRLLLYTVDNMNRILSFLQFEATDFSTLFQEGFDKFFAKPFADFMERDYEDLPKLYIPPAEVLSNIWPDNLEEFIKSHSGDLGIHKVLTKLIRTGVYKKIAAYLPGGVLFDDMTSFIQLIKTIEAHDNALYDEIWRTIFHRLWITDLQVNSVETFFQAYAGSSFPMYSVPWVKLREEFIIVTTTKPPLPTRQIPPGAILNSDGAFDQYVLVDGKGRIGRSLIRFIIRSKQVELNDIYLALQKVSFIFPEAVSDSTDPLIEKGFQINMSDYIDLLYRLQEFPPAFAMVFENLNIDITAYDPEFSA